MFSFDPLYIHFYILCLFYGIWETNFENAINCCTGQSMKPFFSQQIWKIVSQVQDWPWKVDSTAVQRCTCNGRLFSLIVSTQVEWLFSSVSSHGVLDERALRGIWHDRRKEKITVLETQVSSSCLVGTIAKRNVLILHCRAPCPACTLTPSML
jgi:hypothetical protein